MPEYTVQEVDKLVSECFHGTELEVAKRIESGEPFRIGRNRNNYLGDGVYFFEKSIEAAVWWAAEKRKYEEYGILEADVLLGKCLDLSDDRYFKMLEHWAKTWRERLRKPLTEAWVINSFAKACDGGFDTVRCEFPGKVLFYKSKIRKNDIVLCVRTTKNILTVKMARSGKKR
jgi:hypothetical protein